MLVASNVAHWTAHGFGPSLAWDGDACVGISLLQHTVANGYGEVELGWSVSRERWGQGIGTELGRDTLARPPSRGGVLRALTTGPRNGYCRSSK